MIKKFIQYFKKLENRFLILKIFLFLIPLILLARAFQIQIIGDERLKRLSQSQFRSKVLIRPERGIIYDRNKQPISMNGEAMSIAVDTKKIKNSDLLAEKLGRSLGVSQRGLKKKLSVKRDFLWIKRHLSENEIKKLHKEKVIDLSGSLIDGLWLVKEDKRVYPQGEVASPVIGTVNIDMKGREGLELHYNKILQGEKKSIPILRDSFGRKAFFDTKNINEDKNGDPIILSIDIPLQYSVEKKLKQAIKNTGSLSGSVIVMNAENGEILALANFPMFDPRKKSASFDSRRNRAVTDGYEPGSTLKPLLMAAALKNKISKNEKVWGGLGEFVVQGKKITEAESHDKFEWLTLEDMVALSSNVGAAKFALKLGADKYLSTLIELGFGEKTQIEFPGEISGRLPSEKNIQPLTLANIGFGQGLFATPMQVIRAYATLINGGRLVKPRLILSKENQELENLEKPIWSPSVTSSVLDALVKVVKNGTGRKAQLPGFLVAGKTGTSQVVDPKTRTYSKEHYMTSFVGFPLGVDQKIVIYTQLNRPRGIFYASETAAPLFREVLSEVVSRFRIPHNPLLMMDETKNPILTLPKIVDSLEVKQSAPQLLTHEERKRKLIDELFLMPDMTGLTQREVIQSLTGHDIQLKILGTGYVIRQTPSAGVELKDGQKVVIRLREK